MPRALITGAGRGIGLQFARQYRASGCEVAAICQMADAAIERTNATGSGRFVDYAGTAIAW